MKFLLNATLLVAVSVPFAKANIQIDKSQWNGVNSPTIMSDKFETNYQQLPKGGSLKSLGLGWPGHYWPNKKGGIAQRWNSFYPNHFEYESPTRYEAMKMSQDEINKLSPAEKYDLYVGDYNYSTVKWAWSVTSRFAKIWHGICHGVSPASLNHPEPMNITLKNKDGINITFYSSDIKALLAFYYAKVDDSSISQVGKRCFFGRRNIVLNQVDGCGDVNAGSFHIILANRLGILKKGFIADIDRYKEVWNHAALEYNTLQLSVSQPTEKSAPGTVKRVLVKTSVKYAASIDPAKHEVIGTPTAKYDERFYQYWLELDYNENIIGGEWVSNDRPDFLWFKNKATFSGHFEKLNEIYKTRY